MLSGCLTLMLFQSCGFMGSLFQPQDDGYRPPQLIVYPIASSDSILVQKLIDTNRLQLQVPNIAIAANDSRVVSLDINLWWGDSANTPDTFIVPELICGLDSLKFFGLENASVKYLALPLKGEKKSNVRSLSLTFNKLSTIPPNLSFFGRLESLRLDGNLLDSVATFDLDCPELSTLGLSQNRLRTLPDNIAAIPKLTNLFLSDNELASLPRSILNHGSLWATLWGNRFCNVPDSTARLLSALDSTWKKEQKCK
jgi:hypothetical protein